MLWRDERKATAGRGGMPVPLRRLQAAAGNVEARRGLSNAQNKLKPKATRNERVTPYFAIHRAYRLIVFPRPFYCVSESSRVRGYA